MVAHLAIIFRGYQNLLDKNVFFSSKKLKVDKNSMVTLIWWKFSRGIQQMVGSLVLHNRTNLSMILTLIKTGSKILRTGTVAKFWPFVDSLIQPFTG